MKIVLCTRFLQSGFAGVYPGLSAELYNEAYAVYHGSTEDRSQQKAGNHKIPYCRGQEILTVLPFSTLYLFSQNWQVVASSALSLSDNSIVV